MGFSFNEDKILVTFKAIKRPYLLVLNLVVHIPFLKFDFLKSFVVNIDS
jgi:hypothetical protein